jgi:NDP-sugar pyrophosphorylase family protein
MKPKNILPLDRFGYDFIPVEYLPSGADEYWLRNAQQAEHFSKKPEDWRKLKTCEIKVLTSNKNYCPNWDNFFVCDPFEPSLIRDSYFYGLVRIGSLQNVFIRHHDFCAPAGIRNSTIISCDIGDDTAIQNCAFISHYIIGNNCILSEVNELQTTNHAKFGNGAIKDGEAEEVRVWIDVMNEAGGRSILPFENMIAADAYLWAAYRDDTALAEKLTEITQKQYGGLRGSYGIIGNGAVIKSCAIIKDAAVGEYAYIKGANKLKNITIKSSAEEPTQIGEGVEMVNGIVGYACNVFYGSKAVRFVMGRNSNLKYGARLIHSVLGDNSTVSCCEILNNLIFPVHEQHHNNSFLIASLIQGMSNMAAAATIGSNHNSRANDGEIRAKRGFWPGLAVSLKHSSVFASFVIIAKGEYPSELNIPLPFSLLNNNVYKNRLEVLPAYYWIHNLYALERNSWKAKNRDKRKNKIQRIEFDYLAPDTAEEIIAAVALLKNLVGEADLTALSTDSEDGDYVHQIPCRSFENNKRGQMIIKPLEAIVAYHQMLHYYAVKTVASFFDERLELDYRSLCELMNTDKQRVKDWVNIGGQIVPAFRVDELRNEIGEGKYKNWDEIHDVYKSWDEEYPVDKCRHAWAVLELLNSSKPSHEANTTIDASGFRKELVSVLEIRRWIDRQIYESREKDYHNQFKKATYRNQAEMEQVLGKPDDNAFIMIVQKESVKFKEMIDSVSSRLK